MTYADQTAARQGSPPSEPGGARTYLLVVENDSSFLCHLPRTGTVVIGRAPEAEVLLTHASVSRRHACIHIEDGVARVSDLGSHNGTRLNGEPVPHSRMLSSGDVVSVGDVLLVVHTTTPAVVARAVMAEPAWRRRLAEEIDRALTYRRSLAVVAIDGIPVTGWDAAAAEIGAGLRLIDVVGHGDDGQLLVLLPEVERAAAHEVARRALIAVAGTGARAGVAACPLDACDLDAILLATRAAARAAAPHSVGHPADAATRIELGERSVLIADPAMSRQFALLERLAAATLPVLITGETGVGKEAAAYAVHHWSKRRGGAFVAVNCAALGPESLIEAELFGYERGAFTGATAAKAGLFETASGGTVFLDEVGELSLSVQAKLLRVLESQKVTRIGEVRERAVDVRIVAATNRVVDDEVRAGRFRQDLFFRLGGATVVLPPLRERRCEIPLLARDLLDQACTRAERSRMEITPATMRLLLTHDWPGNVRELRNTMDYVAAAAPDGQVEPYDLPDRFGGTTPSTTQPMAAVALPDGTGSAAAFRPIADELRDLERGRMAEALVAAGGVKSRAAQLIDMPIRTFTLKAKQYKL